MAGSMARKSLLWFYLLTPGFVLLDFVFAWDIRVSFLDNHPVFRIIYYMFCMLIALMMWKRPALEPILGILEGGINFFLLTASVLLPYYEAIDAISEGRAVDYTMNTANIINYLLTGMIIIFSLRLRKLDRSTSVF